MVLMKKHYLTYEEDHHYVRLISTGEWMLKSVLQIESELRKVPATKKIIWDLSGVSDFDSAGVLKYEKLIRIHLVWPGNKGRPILNCFLE